MCGIVGYLGKKAVVPILLDGLKNLEYRGYDSAGVAFLDNDELSIYKAAGKLVNLRQSLPERVFHEGEAVSHVGIGHTRWATHGAPDDMNAHPHMSSDGNIALIHNGIIENYSELRDELSKKGYEFISKTDTECIVHLVEDIAKSESDFMRVIQLATERMKGAYALAIIDKRQPEKLYGVRSQAPLVLGIGQDDLFLASDIVAMVEHTNQVAYLHDGQIVELSPDGFRVMEFSGNMIQPTVETISGSNFIVDKKGFKHFMLKEIYEQPDVVRNSLSSRLIRPEEPIALLDQDQLDILDTIDRVYVVACGTSFNAGLVAKYFFEELVRLPVEVEAAGEFRYRNQLVDEKTLVIAISQSGETADTLMAIRQSHEKGAKVLAVTNREDSSLAREADMVLPVRAGVEVSVCATKSFTAQIIVLYLLGLQLMEAKNLASTDELQAIKTHLQRLPVLIEQMLADTEPIQQLAKQYGHVRDMIFIARGINYPVALEGALKLKEISYIHAEGYSGSELKHGPIAMLDQEIPVVAVLAEGPLFDKMISNCEEAKARDAQVIGVISGELADEKKETFADILNVPQTHSFLTPVLTTIPLQLLAYYIAEYLGKDVDQPRNLAKSVTVE